MKLWIDAAAADPRLRVFGMTLVERHVRGARHKAGAAIAALVDGNGAAFLEIQRGKQFADDCPRLADCLGAKRDVVAFDGNLRALQLYYEMIEQHDQQTAWRCGQHFHLAIACSTGRRVTHRQPDSWF